MKKNVIYILCDQLRAQSLGCYGDFDAKTPNIDLLAKEGTLFENAVATTPLCTPARGNMMTGRYVHDHTAHGHNYHLTHNIPFVSDLFKENDYTTMYFGKWHLQSTHFREANDDTTLIVPRKNRGNFDIWVGYENNNNQHHFRLHGHNRDDEIAPYLVNDYETDYITDLALTHIEENKNKEMFVWMNFQPPHNPYVAPAKYADMFNPRGITLRNNVPLGGEYERQAREDLAGYNAMIKCIDDNVGKLVSKLKSLGIYEDTHIVFTSDHGDMHGSHGQYRKTTYWEESIKVPMIIGGTSSFDNEGIKKETIQSFVDQYDIAPTLLGLAGIEKDEGMVGIDFSYVRYEGKRGEKKTSTIFGNYIPTGHEYSFNKQFRGIISDSGYKYVVGEDGEIALFDLTTDKYEQANLIYNPQFEEQLIIERHKLIKGLEAANDPFINLEVFHRVKKM